MSGAKVETAVNDILARNMQPALAEALRWHGLIAGRNDSNGFIQPSCACKQWSASEEGQRYEAHLAEVASHVADASARSGLAQRLEDIALDEERENRLDPHPRNEPFIAGHRSAARCIRKRL